MGRLGRALARVMVKVTPVALQVHGLARGKQMAGGLFHGAKIGLGDKC